MKDARLVELKLRAEKDKMLSDGAHRSLALIVSDRYLSHDLADAEFELPWTTLKIWHDISRSTAEGRIHELVERGYLIRTELKNCPPTWHYKLVLKCVKSHAFVSVKLDPQERQKNGAFNCATNPAHHISNSLREEINKKNGVGAALAAKPATPTQETTISSGTSVKPRIIAEIPQGELNAMVKTLRESIKR